MRVTALADSDSYVKWAASLLTRVPADWQVSLVVVRTAKEPSRGQLAAALHDSAFDPTDVEVLEFDDAVALVARERPDAVVLATIGPLADLLGEAVLATSPRRPVLISGIPGIAYPARRKALIYRSQIDLVVLHSKLEIRAFTAIANSNGLQHEFALASLPFLDRSTTGRENGDIVFAAQAIVPPLRSQRLMLLGWLVAAARAHPERRVVLKVRAVDGEGQTHDEVDSYPALLRVLGEPPANLVVDNGPMRSRLASASGLVTVSSTAAIEAIALGVPVLVIDDFGISPELINQVFRGSGLLGSARDLVDGSFRQPRAGWLDQNYFHSESENTWIAAIERLVAQNRLGTLARRERIVRGRGGSLRRAWDRKRVLGRYDRSLAGFVALIVGTPARTLALALGELRALISDEVPPRKPVALEHETTESGDPVESTPRSR